jgi:hypothetical protein
VVGPQIRPGILQVLAAKPGEHAGLEDWTIIPTPPRRPSAGLDAVGRRRAGAIAGWITAIVLSVAAAWLEQLTGDISISLIVVLAFAMLLGAIWRERAWRWGLLTGLALPLMHFVRGTLIHHETIARTLVLFVAFVPALVGAYMGAFLNKMVSALFGREDRGGG